MSGVLDRIDQVLVSLFEAGPTDRSQRRAHRSRLGACVAISLTGIALLLPNLAPFLEPGQPAVGLGLAGLGVAVCLGLVVAGALLYRSGFSTPNAVRIAGWNFLGLVVLGVVLLTHGAYRDALGAVTTADALAAGNVLAISAAAHVIIGVHDAQRVRAQQLAREREKFAVLSRVLRHNLRNDATVLMGQSDRLASQLDDPSLTEVAETVRRHSEEVGDLATKTRVMVDALDRRSASNVRVNVGDAVDTAVTGVDPDAASLSVDVADDLWIWADEQIESALAELVENAVEHGGERVRITATDADGTVEIRVADDGPGVPEDERAVVTGREEITQLTHGSGLGLWIARSVAEAANGTLAFETDEEWTVVSLAHERAAPPAAIAGDAATATA
ncbi:Histidine kinase-, DNA gyrase B-, and HSP90-like ATPase [Haloplanus vescus]|uniref:histidine kinase n=1 Tax=Haloplanus vescus TaxID=555874 RepID=A0A1H3ZL25_9EURY|nr:Histidine kinase-, DNA gyrase B-, and HSP90-like ATPase [Haloplanus vescus]